MDSNIPTSSSPQDNKQPQYFAGIPSYSNGAQIDIQQDGMVQIVLVNTIRGSDGVVLAHTVMTLVNFQEMCRKGLMVIDQHQAKEAERRARGLQ